MTMYLANDDVHPVGWEPLEFLDLPPMAEVQTPGLASNAADASDVHLVSDSVVPEPEPQEIDESTSMELRRLSTDIGLRGHPLGDAKCENCRYYLENTADISYCWHPKVRILVGAEWCCERWESI